MEKKEALKDASSLYEVERRALYGESIRNEELTNIDRSEFAIRLLEHDRHAETFRSPTESQAYPSVGV